MSDPATNDPTQPPEKPLTPEEMAAGISELLGLPEAEPKEEPKQ